MFGTNLVKGESLPFARALSGRWIVLTYRHFVTPTLVKSLKNIQSERR